MDKDMEDFDDVDDLDEEELGEANKKREYWVVGERY
jgi:hypothetical protein